jgi:hypothetical protein
MAHKCRQEGLPNPSSTPVHCHTLHAIFVDGTGLLSGPDRLGQQPFDTLLANAPAPTIALSANADIRREGG